MIVRATLTSFFLAAAAHASGDRVTPAEIEDALEEGVQMTWQDYDTLMVKARAALPNGCHFPSAAGIETPDGLPEIANAIPLRLEIRAEGEMCTMEFTMHSFNQTVRNVPEETEVLVIYRIRSNGDVDATAHALPPRPRP